MRILLIDDDVNLGKVIAHQLGKSGYTVDTAINGRDGLKLFAKSDYDVLISDIQMPDISGIDVLEAVRKTDGRVVIILITAYGSVNSAIDACKLGADDYITKPFGREQLLFTVEKNLRLRQLETENETLKDDLQDKFQFDNMIAGSGAMQQVLKITHKVAQSSANVMILGESGTGKELIAKAIHYNSARKDKPLITINCPSIPGNLLESELFGHVKGAFTGALKDRKGKFELADGGTIFLDEIGDLHEDLQAKLLRFLQEREFERIGGDKIIKVDVRLIAATNQDLPQLIKEKKFREDLYYRLSVIPIQLPPLRGRKEDIPFLIDFFVMRYGGGKNYKVDPKVIKALMNYSWPGNVRELENVIERVVTLASDDKIIMDDLPAYLTATESTLEISGFSIQIPEEGIALDVIEKNIIEMVLNKVNGNQSEAARLLKIPRHVLLYRMKKFGMGQG